MTASVSRRDGGVARESHVGTGFFFPESHTCKGRRGRHLVMLASLVLWFIGTLVHWIAAVCDDVAGARHRASQA